MIERALNSDNDIFLSGGSIRTTNEGAQVLQHVRTRLLFYLEEWFLDTTTGTPWFQEILTKPVDLARVESIIKTRITDTPGVEEIIDFAMDYVGGTTRKLTVTFSAITTFGEIDNLQVTING